MPLSDRWGTHQTPCPKCNQEKVEYWFFDSDCRGNEASGGIQCKGCGKKFTSKEWNEWEEVHLDNLRKEVEVRLFNFAGKINLALNKSQREEWAERMVVMIEEWIKTEPKERTRVVNKHKARNTRWLKKISGK